MAPGYSESPRGLVYTERPMAWPLRGFILLVGLGVFVVPVPFALHAPWRTPELSTLLAVACIVLPCLVGALFVRIALGGPRRIEFDRAGRCLLHTRRGLLGTRQLRIGFDRIDRIEIVRRESMDYPDFFALMLHAAGRRPMEVGAFDDPAQAQHWQRRIEALVRA
ncbi:hypothetical protein V4F39_22370 [Aquincola sp. MAHUQ-54]|uniref:PH domain-containing protein n=1 Tax=Aquincola agrisoli TaxID=3119538 RepID=A0AAW9QA30_9BURK